MSNPKFEIQHFTLCNGWINTWHEYDDDNNEVPMIFDTFGDALLELDNFLADEIKAYNMGDIESPYGRDEFRIAEIKTSEGDTCPKFEPAQEE